MGTTSIQIFPHPDFPNRAKLFYEKYELVSILNNGNEKFSKRSLKMRTERVCLFCGRQAPSAKFHNYSHLISQLIGNTNLYSDFECDECNARFSAYEDSLANFIGISRSIIGLNDLKKTKGFDAKKIVAKSRSFVGDNILIIAPEDLVRDDEIVGKSTFRYTKNSFTPAYVFKSLLKSAVGLLGPDLVSRNYPMALDYVQEKLSIDKGAMVSGYRLSFNYNSPLLIYTFEKRNNAGNIPVHVIVFHYQNYIMALPMPFYKESRVSDLQSLEIVLPPPYFSNEHNIPISFPQAFERDFSSTKVIEDEEESVVVQMDIGSKSRTVAYGPTTDTTTERDYNPEGIKYLIVTREGTIVEPKKLSAFVNEQMSKHS